MTTALAKYEAARAALAAAHRIDEVKSIRDKVQAIAAYAKQARDTQLIKQATEIKVRAEMRCGELLKAVERSDGGRPAENSSKAETSYQRTLRENNIPRATAARYEQLAAMPKEHFETAIETAKEMAGEVTTAHMLRLAEELRATNEVREMLKPTRADKANAAWLPILEALRLLDKRTKEHRRFPACPKATRNELAGMWAGVAEFFSTQLEQQCHK